MEEDVIEILIEELKVISIDSKLSRLRNSSSTELRNLYQDCLFNEDHEICLCIKIIIKERNSNL
jgi:hypothetical protein